MKFDMRHTSVNLIDVNLLDWVCAAKKTRLNFSGAGKSQTCVIQTRHAPRGHFAAAALDGVGCPEESVRECSPPHA